MTEESVNRVFELLDDPENEDLRAGVNMIFDIENFRENSGTVDICVACA